MAWGTVTVGGIAFREETLAVDDAETLRLAGQEAHPPLTQAAVEAAHGNVVGLRDAAVVPVVFTDKDSLTGFYRVSGARSAYEKLQSGAVATATWELALTRVGTGRDVEIESRVLRIARPDDLAGTQTASFWHAPAVGAPSYFTGPTVPSGTIDRVGEDGTVRVYTGIPADTARWTIRAEDYLRGAARIVCDGIRRAGLISPAAAAWSLSNSLVQVTGSGAAIVLTCFDSGTYRSPATFAFTVNGAPLTGAPELTILRNEPEEVAVRLSYQAAPGQVLVDLALRRGARFVTGVVKRHGAGVLGVVETGTAATTAVTGGVRRSSADADGNRFVLGSARNATLDAANGAITLSGALRLDFFAGHEVGSGAGDLYADLLAQYLGSSGERARVIRR